MNALLAFAAFVLAIFIWVEWQRRIRPLFIARAEIIAIADEMEAAYGARAWEMAMIEQGRAWRYSRNFEQGKWRRVARALERRRRSG